IVPAPLLPHEEKQVFVISGIFADAELARGFAAGKLYSVSAHGPHRAHIERVVMRERAAPLGHRYRSKRASDYRLSRTHVFQHETVADRAIGEHNGDLLIAGQIAGLVHSQMHGASICYARGGCENDE